MDINKIAKKIVADYSNYDSPSVYVGTYAKYNNGDLSGEWVDLDDYDSYSEFLEYCQELHSDEESPEFMFQDYENFPEKYYSEAGLNSELWDYIEKIKEYDKDLVDAVIDNGYDLDDVEDFVYYNNCYNLGDFAEMYVDEMGGLEQLGEDTLKSYFDFQRFGRDLQVDLTIIEHDNGYLVRYN